MLQAEAVQLSGKVKVAASPAEPLIPSSSTSSASSSTSQSTAQSSTLSPNTRSRYSRRRGLRFRQRLGLGSFGKSTGSSNSRSSSGGGKGGSQVVNVTNLRLVTQTQADAARWYKALRNAREVRVFRVPCNVHRAFAAGHYCSRIGDISLECLGLVMLVFLINKCRQYQCHNALYCTLSRTGTSRAVPQVDQRNEKEPQTLAWQRQQQQQQQPKVQQPKQQSGQQHQQQPQQQPTEEDGF